MQQRFKRTIIFLSAVLFLLSQAHSYAHSQTVRAVTQKKVLGKAVSKNPRQLVAEQDPNGIYWGLRNPVTGKLVLNYAYDHIGPFENGFALIELNGKNGLVNSSGKVIAAAEFGVPDNRMAAKCGFVAFEVGYGPMVILDTTGRDAVPITSGVYDVLPCQQRIALGDDRFGMVDFKNDTILPFKFRYTYLPPEGFCVAQAFGDPGGTGYKDAYGLYDLNGKPVLPHVYERIDAFYCGRAIVKKDGKYGAIDEKGKELFYTDYGSIDRYANNYALVHSQRIKGEIKVGIIDRSGRAVVPPIYQWLEYIGNFHEGLAAMAQNRKYGFVDTTGKIVVDFKYDRVEPFKDGLAKVWVGWRWAGYIDRTGKEVIVPDFPAMDQANLRRYYDKFIVGIKDSVQHIFDRAGKEIAQFKYKTIEPFDNEKKSFIVSINHNYGILDSGLQVKLPIKYQSLELIFPGKIAAKEQGKISMLDEDGKTLSSVKYDAVAPVQDEDLALVKINQKRGLINSHGTLIVPAIYDEIREFQYGMAVVRRNGKYGLVNSRGKETIPAIYTRADSFDGNYVKVSLNGKTFNVDRLGKKVAEESDY